MKIQVYKHIRIVNPHISAWRVWEIVSGYETCDVLRNVYANMEVEG